MARIVCYLVAWAGLAASSPALAQSAGPVAAPTLQTWIGDPDDVTISGSVRARVESLDNDFRPGKNQSDTIVSLRTSLMAEYHPGIVRIGGELMDSRVYFDDRGTPVTSNDVDAVELVQGYVGVDLGDMLGKGSATRLQAGRFTMDLGSRRLVGRNNFRNATNAFTGVRADVRMADKTVLTLFYTLPLTRLPGDTDAILHNAVHWDRESFDLTFWGGFLDKPNFAGRASLNLYAFGLNERDSANVATRNRHVFTPGARIYADPEPGKTDFEFEGAYQFGSIRASTAPDAPIRQVSAWFVHGEVGHQFDGAWKPRLSLEYDRASGDHGSGTYGRFDSLYGPRAPDWGPSSIYGPLGRSNISSPGLRLEVTPGKRVDANIMARGTWLASATDSFANTGVRDATGKSGTYAGTQVEGRVRYWLVPKALRLETGAAVLIRGRFLKDAPNANGFGNPLYGYGSITATF